MNEQDQKFGERRVREVLIAPLLRHGLAKPSTLTKDQFAEMLVEIEKKLAYMTELNLEALAEQVIANPGGKDRDRFPVAPRLLEDALDFQRPAADASPLVRAVFAHQLGRQAVSEGWASELLDYLRKHRKWLKGYALSQFREKALESVAERARLRRKQQAGDVLPAAAAAWLRRHEVADALCRRLVADAERAA